MKKEGGPHPNPQHSRPSLLRIVREGRKTKAEARARNVTTHGGIKGSVKELLEARVEEMVREAMYVHRDWLKREWEAITQHYGPAAQGQYGAFLQAFLSTFRGRIKLAARVKNIRLQDILGDTNTLTGVLQQSAFDFFMSLRQSMRRGDTLQQALAIAAKSHWVNPTEIEQFARAYPQAPLRVIKSAMDKRPRDPKSFIEGYLQRVELLREEFPDVSALLIRHAAERYQSTEKARTFLQQAQQRRDRLLKQYENNPEVSQQVVEAAIRFSPKNPQAVIVSYLNALQRLRQEYGDRAPTKVLKDAALFNRREPERYVRDFLEKLEALQQTFPQVPRQHLLEILVRRPQNPEAAVKEYQTVLAQLVKKYNKKVKRRVLQYIARRFPSDSDAAVQAFLARLKGLQNKYEGELRTEGSPLHPSVLVWAALYHPRNPEGAIQAYLKRVQSLQKEFGEKIPVPHIPHIIRYAARTYPDEKAKEYLEWFIRMYQQLMEDEEAHRKHNLAVKCLQKYPFRPLEELRELV